MSAWTGRQMRDRYDRHVRRARLSVSPGVPVHRLAFTMEEAMRLASLPGENEGRSYYFRRLRVTGLPANGLRDVWLDKFQRALDDGAMQAVHGADPRAGFSPSVFFRNEEEAHEILLHRILAREPVDEWFWPKVAAEAGAAGSGFIAHGSASNDGIILAILEKLRSCPASWIAVAAALFAVPQFDAVALLNAIPLDVARAWLDEMEGSQPGPASVAAAIPRPAQPAIRLALRVFGIRNPRALWLAAVAVLLESPSDLAAGTAVWRARGALQEMASEEETAPADPSAAKTAQILIEGENTSAENIALEEPAASAGAIANAAPEIADAPAPTTDLPILADPARKSIPDSVEPCVPPADSAPKDSPGQLPAEAPGEHEPALPPGSALDESAVVPQTTRWQCSGLATAAGGLFFLLNAMEQIGIAQALAGGLGWASPNFAVLVLRRLAALAGIGHDDPILIWLDSLIPQTANEEPLPCGSSWWPSNFRISRDAATIDDLARAWSVAARWWCWRNARLRLPDIVSRAGVFSVNRTDLDVSMPLETADVRVRRVGLDLDPGWLPWFGRVVRFHYLDRGEFHG